MAAKASGFLDSIIARFRAPGREPSGRATAEIPHLTPAATVADRVSEVTSGAARHVSEMIGRVAMGAVAIFKNNRWRKSVDETIPDYAFWDRLRRGKEPGYRLGGLFAKRIERVLAVWVLGGGVAITVDPEPAQPGAPRGHPPGGAVPAADNVDYTNTKLAAFVASLLDAGVQDASDQDDEDQTSSILMTVFKDAIGLGDQYIIVNPDGSLSVPSPETANVERDPLNYRRVTAYEFVTVLDNITITDRYERTGRTVTIKEGDTVKEVLQFANLIGVIPVIHVAQGMTGNEIYGHPIHDPLLELYSEYDDLAYKQIGGAKLLGAPILTLAGLEDLEAVKNLNDPDATETYIDEDGVEQTRARLNIDREAVLLLGKGGTASFTAPPVGFTEDTKNTLKLLFLLLLDHTGIPEVVWGGELGSARATSDTQLDQFVKDIEGIQKDQGGWIVKLCKIWLRYRALTDRRIVVGNLLLEWPPLIGEDDEIQLKKIESAHNMGLLRAETELTLLALVDDPAAEVAAAAKERKARQAEEYPNGTTPQFNARLGQDSTADDDEGDDDEN